MHGISNMRWSSQSSSQLTPPGAPREGDPARQETTWSGPLLRKVLVVDDEEDLASLAEALLCAEGLDVVVANSATEALRILEQDDSIDALFTDVMMPGMTGLQLADAVRDMYPRIKIVLTSGYTLPALLADRQRQYLFTPKPYRIDTVMKLLRS